MLTEPSLITGFIKICSEKQEWKYINLWTDIQLKFFFHTTVTFIPGLFISAPTGTVLKVGTIRPSSILQMRTAHWNLMVLHLSWGRVIEPRHLFVNPCVAVLWEQNSERQRHYDLSIGSNCMAKIFSVMMLKKMASFSVSLLCNTQGLIYCAHSITVLVSWSHKRAKLFRLSGDFLKVFQHLVTVQNIINCTICIHSSWFLTEWEIRL